MNLGHGCTSGSSYYSIQPRKDFRIIFADGYDVSLLGWPEGHPLHEEAAALLNKNNPNEVTGKAKASKKLKASLAYEYMIYKKPFMNVYMGCICRTRTVQRAWWVRIGDGSSLEVA